MIRTEARPLLHHLFAARIEAAPDDVALVESDRSVTYAELGRAVQRVAAGLRDEGIGAGAMVGLHMERSVEWVACVLATLQLHGAVVPLPPSFPGSRLHDIARFAELDAVIDARPAPSGTPFPGRQLPLRRLLASDGPPPEPGAGDPDRPAFVLCTSGSTGRPKLIVRSHRSFFHRLRWTWTRHPFEPGERGCQKSHMTTTHAIYELFEPLLWGTPVEIIADREVRDLERFWEKVRASGVSRLLLVPAQLRASLAMPGFAAPPLNVLVLMGEYVSPVLADTVLEAFPSPTSIYSIYGSTEASSTLVCDLRASFRRGKELPLGAPIADEITARVLDRTRRPVPPGEQGRLHVSGPALFDGYLGQPALTASVLVDVPDPGGSGSVRMYDTGDDVRRTPDGELEFVGRVDDTVKVRGFRVDLGEVEGVLLSHPGVRQAAVVRAEGDGTAGALHGFVVPASVDPEEVRETVRSRLPDYMVPSRLTALDQLPLTASGKLDRLRLARLHASDARAPASRPAELTEAEKEVAEVWSGVLGAGAPWTDGGFFEAGGTSLSAFTLVHRLRERFGLNRDALDVETVYRCPTIRGLAAHLERCRRGDGPGPGDVPSPLLTLRPGRAPGLRPIYFVAPAGGTLGPYGKLARTLETPRELVGIRDPFNWGGRNPSEGFDRWVGSYLDAIRARQPTGPYDIVAYSSAAPFGYEIARRLRHLGEAVPTLVLADPLGLDRGGRSRYGWWVMKAVTERWSFRALVRLLGALRVVPLSRLPVLRRRLAREDGAAAAPDPEAEIERACRDRYHVLSLSALLELNTGIPYALEPEALEGVPPEAYIEVLRDRVHALTPEVDFEVVEAAVRQYPLQVRAQEGYRLKRFGGDVLLVQAEAPYASLVAAQLRPYVRRLRTRVLALGEPSERIHEISRRWGPTAPHFRSLRDDRFVEALAGELEALWG